MKAGRIVVVAALALTVPRPGTAQSAGDRGVLRLFRDSLATIDDSVALRSVEQRDIAEARRQRDDAMLHLRLGFIAMRLGDVTGQSDHYGDAKTEFDWARELRADWPYPWFGAGLASLKRSSAQSPFLVNLIALYGGNAFGEAGDDLVESARRKPAFPQGLIDVADLVLAEGREQPLVAVLAAFRRAAGTPAAESPGAMLARAAIEDDVGQPDSALAIVDRLLTRDPDNAGALLQRARTLFGSGRATGAADWFRGLALGDSAVWVQYRGDVAMVVPDSTLRALDHDTPAERAGRMRRFWAARDTLSGGADRLAEHYRRLTYALQHFALTWHGDPRNAAASLDDRGVVYVRQGPPDEEITLDISGVPPNASWRYREPGGDLVLHFLARNSHAPYRLVPSVLDILAASGQARIGHIDTMEQGRIETYGAGLIAQTAQALLESRESISPIYGRMLAQGIGGARKLQAEERAAGRHADTVALHTDRWRMGYELALHADVQMLDGGTHHGRSTVQVAVAIPGASLVPRREGRQWVYVVRTRIAIMHADGSSAALIDTTRGFLAPQWIAPDGQLLETIAVPVPPGRYTVVAAIESAGRGLIVPRRTIEVAALTGNRPALSDLALGTRSVPLWWLSDPGDTTWIDPATTFHRDDPVELGFQVGGMPPGAHYHAELTIVRVSSHDVAAALAQPALRGQDMLRLGFDHTAPGGVVDSHRQLSLEKLKAGDYILEVAITTPAGGRAVRRRHFLIVK
jgi:GWxTD domain-containing protein